MVQHVSIRGMGEPVFALRIGRGRRGFALAAIASAVGVCALQASESQAATAVACVKKGSGATRIVSSSASCRRGERRVSLGRRGPQGRRGPGGVPGPQGPAGPAGPSATSTIGLKAVERSQLPACSTAAAAPTCQEALARSVVLFQNAYAIVKGSCYGQSDPDNGIPPDLSRTTAQITVQTTNPGQQNLFVSYLTTGLDSSFTTQQVVAQKIGSSSVPLRVDNRQTTADATSNDVWGAFVQLTVIDGSSAGKEQGFSATIIPFANFTSGCRFLGTTNNL